MKQIVLASHNQGKLEEISNYLTPLGFKIFIPPEREMASIKETGLTFVENALLKARHASLLFGMPAIGDDSGLAVDVLLGAPGIYSARYAGTYSTDADNNTKLLEKLQLVPEKQRMARFHCVLVYLRHTYDPSPIITQGIWRGLIGTRMQGMNGFGYDPIFFLPNLNCTAAELSDVEKMRQSHRGQALRKLRAALSHA